MNMNVIASELARPSFISDYVDDLERLLAAAEDAERHAADAIGDLEPLTPARSSALRAAVDRLNAAREWKEAIAAQLFAIERHGRR
jgi:NAD(P)H-dependent FMN reductase